MILAEGRLSLLNRKISKLLQPSVQLYFVILILFALASALFSIPLAVLEAVVVLILGLYTRTSGHKRRREITKYIENITGNVDVATKDTMVNSPLPMVIFRPESDDIIWTNDRFLRLTGDREHLFDAKLSSVVPGFDTRWLLEGKNECPDHVSFCGRRFVVYGHLVRTGDKGGGFLATTYWVDVTELCETRDKYLASRPVMAVLLLDNYEDLMKNLTENERSAIYSEINARLDAWVADTPVSYTHLFFPGHLQDLTLEVQLFQDLHRVAPGICPVQGKGPADKLALKRAVGMELDIALSLIHI